MSRRHVTWQDVKWVSEAFSDGFGDAGLHVRAQQEDQMPKGYIQLDRMLDCLLLSLKNINELHYRWVCTRENSECMSQSRIQPGYICAFEWIERYICAFEWRVWQDGQPRH